jgi:hypothetical protein
MSINPTKNGGAASPSKEGLKGHERKFQHDVIKGRLAETLVEQLFLSMDYKVFRFGMENTIPGIMGLLKGIKSDVAQHIKRMPDFVVQNTKTGQVNFVEVKFRANEHFDYGGLKGDYPFSNVFIIVVSKKHIKCLSVEELKNGKCINPNCGNYLGSRKEFELDKQVIIDFCAFASHFFANVN